ncbi:hypothetical protein PT974_10303 [Cladobotryum mycophilum]|uniref:MYND-type domain-containing protein n=1 Tax=Cladobotryum mycophilum TaxID=491253 RepID=A0ABR0S9H2_9HYPO
MSEACNKCKKSPPEVTIKRCAKCSTTPYCSRDCQKADWKVHKKICGQTPGHSVGSSSSSTGHNNLSPRKGLDQPIAKPFTRLDSNTWLHDRSEKDVYRLLIDAHRMRVADMYNFEGEKDELGVYGNGSDVLAGFRRFLEATASRPGLLPPWWNASKQKECEDLGMDASQWCDLGRTVEKHDITEHYGDSDFPMQLRIWDSHAAPSSVIELGGLSVSPRRPSELAIKASPPGAKTLPLRRFYKVPAKKDTATDLASGAALLGSPKDIVARFDPASPGKTAVAAIMKEISEIPMLHDVAKNDCPMRGCVQDLRSMGQWRQQWSWK